MPDCQMFGNYNEYSARTSRKVCLTNETRTIPAKDNLPQVLTRNALRLKNRETRIARRNRLKHAPVGKRSSLRLNKTVQSAVKIDRASRQAADLCNGMVLDGDPSKKLLFMLSLGLVPKTDKLHGPIVKLDSLAACKRDVSKTALKCLLNTETCPPTAKENADARSYCEIIHHSNAENSRKLRSSQSANKIDGTMPEDRTIDAFKGKSRNTAARKLTQNIDTVSTVKKGILTHRRQSQNLTHSFSGIKLVSASRLKSSRKQIICIDLTENEDEEVLFIGANKSPLMEV